MLEDGNDGVCRTTLSSPDEAKAFAGRGFD
jgi:hypothetical protein